MAYKTLMVHLQTGQSNAALIKVAGDLAERFRATVIGIAASRPTQIIYSDGYVPGEVIEQDREELENEIKTVETAFRNGMEGRAGRIEWRSAITFGSPADYLAQEARCADLLLTGVDASTSMFDRARHVDLGDLVMQAGRGVLVVPASVDRLTLDHAMIGWKDTPETRRAIYDALPLLAKAARVTVVEIAVEDEMSAARLHLQDVAGWLGRHGVEANVLAATSTGDDTNRLNSFSRVQDADLIIAGAYGHSRLREWVLGGVTRDLLLRPERCSFVSH